MQPLPTRRDLQAVEQQVETCRVRVGQRVRIERTRRERKSQHEHRCDTVRLFRQPAELTLGIGVEVIDEVRAP